MHSKKTIILVFVILIIGGYFYFSRSKNTTINNPSVSGPKDATYTIDKQKVTLKNGISETTSVPNSSSKTITRYFGNEVKHDFDGDGREDIAFLLTQETGGSGTFYYVVAALDKQNGYVGSEGLFLGDRIAPQTTGMGNGNVIIVNYADRKPGEPFTTPPSVGKSIWLLLDPKTMQFGEVAQNFEGEADPDKMTLEMKKWNWINTTYNDGKKVEPIQKKFTLTFKGNKTFSLTTDCNSGGGEYTVNGNKISFTKMMTTLMACNEATQESDFTRMLNETESYHFTSKGELVFDLKFDSGVMIFR